MRDTRDPTSTSFWLCRPQKADTMTLKLCPDECDAHPGFPYDFLGRFAADVKMNSKIAPGFIFWQIFQIRPGFCKFQEGDLLMWLTPGMDPVKLFTKFKRGGDPFRFFYGVSEDNLTITRFHRHANPEVFRMQHFQTVHSHLCECSDYMPEEAPTDDENLEEDVSEPASSPRPPPDLELPVAFNFTKEKDLTKCKTRAKELWDLFQTFWGDEQRWKKSVAAYNDLLSQSSVDGISTSAKSLANSLLSEAKEIKAKLDMKKHSQAYEKYRDGWEFVNGLFYPQVFNKPCPHPLDVLVAKKDMTVIELKTAIGKWVAESGIENIDLRLWRASIQVHKSLQGLTTMVAVIQKVTDLKRQLVLDSRAIKKVLFERPEYKDTWNFIDQAGKGPTLVRVGDGTDKLLRGLDKKSVVEGGADRNSSGGLGGGTEPDKPLRGSDKKSDVDTDKLLRGLDKESGADTKPLEGSGGTDKPLRGLDKQSDVDGTDKPLRGLEKKINVDGGVDGGTTDKPLRGLEKESDVDRVADTKQPPRDAPFESPLVREPKEVCLVWKKRFLEWMQTMSSLLGEGRHDLTHWREAEKRVVVMKSTRSLKVFGPQIKEVKSDLFESAREILSKASGNETWLQAHLRISKAVAAAEVEEKRQKAEETKKALKKKQQKKKNTQEVTLETPGYLADLEIQMVSGDLGSVPETTTPTLSLTATPKKTNVVRK